MITPNFTPGPWSSDKWAPGYTVSAPDSHYSICHLEDCNNAEANARLIAAAPALYAALQTARNIVFASSGKQETWKPELQTIDAALALVDSDNATTGAEIASRL